MRARAARLFELIRADKRSVWHDSNEKRCLVPLLAHKHYIEHLSNSSYSFIEENYIALFIDLSPSHTGNRKLILWLLMIYIEVLWSETISLCKKLNIIMTCNPEPQTNGPEWCLLHERIILLNRFCSVNGMNQFIKSDWSVWNRLQLEQHRSTSYSLDEPKQRWIWSCDEWSSSSSSLA